jgi:hypothetical protein
MDRVVPNKTMADKISEYGSGRNNHHKATLKLKLMAKRKDKPNIATTHATTVMTFLTLIFLKPLSILSSIGTFHELPK